jgi:NADH:ubiquinone oxidoreductase subunit 6 (subunit J)
MVNDRGLNFMQNMSFIATLFIVVILGVIISSLGFGLYYLVKDQSNTKRTVHALTIRIALSLFLFFALWFAYFMGWISPHGL